MDKNDIKIDVYLSGAERTLKAMRELQQNANSMSRKKLKIAIEAQTKQANNEIKRLQAQLAQLRKVPLKELQSYVKSGKFNESVWGFGEKLKTTKDQIQQIRQRIAELRAEAGLLKTVDITPRVDWSVFTRVSSVIRNIGSSMLSLSGSIGRITAPLDMLTRGSFYAAAYGGLNKISEGLSRSFSRYDTMKTYPKIMASLGYGSKEAQTAIDRLDKSVRGLPTSLDDIVSVQKQFVLASGDMKKATDLAIAANNAFIGGGATEEQRMYGLRQLQDLLSAGKLRTQEWYSLFKSMPAGIKAAGEELGYTGKKAKEFRTALMEGTVSTDDFLNALIKVGLEGGKMYKLAQEMKTTWSALSSNISIAFARMGEHVLETLDEIFKTATGKTLLENAMGLKDYIDEISKGVQDWVSANPQTIINFFDALKRIDVASVLKGMAQPLMTMGNLLMKFMNMLGGDGANFGKWFMRLHIFGKVLGILGGGIKGLAPVVGFSAMMGRFFKTTEGWGKLAKVGAIDRVIKFFNRFKKVEKSVEAVEAAGGAAAGAAGATASVGTLLTGLLKVVTPAITIGAYAGAFALVGKAIASFAKSLKALDDIKISSWGNVYTNLLNVTAIVTALGALAGALGAATSNPIGGITAGMMAIGGAELFGLTLLAKQIADTMNALATVKVPDKKRLSKIGNALKDIATMYEQIDTGNFGETIARTARSWGDKKFIQNIESMTSSLTSVLDNVIAMMDKIKKISSVHGITKDSGRVKSISETLSGFITDFYGIANAIVGGDFGTKEQKGGSVGGQRKATIGDATKTLDKLSSYLETMDATMTGIEAIPKHFIRIKEKMKKLTAAFGTKGGTLDTSAITTNIQNVVNVIEAVVNEGNLNKLKAATDQMASTNIDSLTSQLDKIPTLLTSLQKLRDFFSNNGTKWLTPTGTETGFQNLRSGGGLMGLGQTKTTYESGGAADNMIQSIHRTVEAVNQIANELSRAKDIEAKATEFKTGVTALYNAYIRFTRFRNYVQKNPAESGSLKTTISTMISDLKSGLNGSTEIFANSVFLKAAVKNVQSSFKSLSTGKGGSIATFVSYLKKIPPALRAVNAAMKGRGAAWKRALVSGFSGTAKEIVNKINSIATAVNQNGASLAFFQAGATAGQSYVNGFNSAVGNAGGLASQVLGTIGGAINGLFAHTGGLIKNGKVLYRGAGGTVFQPRGTDTVPAMLSEGEYVMRKKAVSAYGTKFMQRLNHLDLGGAVRSLGMRGGQLAYATPNLVVDNSKHITYNNNQSLNLTNNHASQGYSEVRASRYLRNM